MRFESLTRRQSIISWVMFHLSENFTVKTFKIESTCSWTTHHVSSKLHQNQAVTHTHNRRTLPKNNRLGGGKYTCTGLDKHGLTLSGGRVRSTSIEE